jgi:hypothetical protein
VLAFFLLGSLERSHEVVDSSFAVGVWRDHTKWCASCCNGGVSQEITPSGVLAVFMLGSPERSHRVVH